MEIYQKYLLSDLNVEIFIGKRKRRGIEPVQLTSRHGNTDENDTNPLIRR